MFRNAMTPLRASLRASILIAGKQAAGVRQLSTQAKASSGQRRFLTMGALTLATAGAVTLGASKTLDASSPTPDVAAIRAKIAKLIEEDDSRGPLLLRLAWHASGTYDKVTKTGGSNGATMRFPPESDHGANAGLHLARALLEPIKKAHPEISYSDLWTLAGAVAVEELGGPHIKWRPGRKDKDDGTHCTPNGRLPDADKGNPEATAKHVREIFYRMGFNDREIVALVGAHALGRAHPDRSGYSGPWTRAETSFSNEFFRELLENKWTPKKWNGPLQYEDPTGELMMLPADMVFIQDPEFRKFTEMYAKDEKLFFKDFAKAFQKLEELGTSVGGGWFSWLWGN